MSLVHPPSAYQIQMMAHATGRAADGHRNHYVASLENRHEWMTLVEWGYAGSIENDGAAFYVTPHGLDVLYGVLRVKRPQEKKKGTE